MLSLKHIWPNSVSVCSNLLKNLIFMKLYSRKHVLQCFHCENKQVGLSLTKILFSRITFGCPVQIDLCFNAFRRLSSLNEVDDDDVLQRESG